MFHLASSTEVLDRQRIAARIARRQTGEFRMHAPGVTNQKSFVDHWKSQWLSKIEAPAVLNSSP